MAVYVDDMYAGYGRMKMCHMIADTSGELLAMAKAIGVDRKWIQNAGTGREHFDVCMSKKARALTLGALHVTRRDMVKMIRSKVVLDPIVPSKENGPESEALSRL